MSGSTIREITWDNFAGRGGNGTRGVNMIGTATPKKTQVGRSRGFYSGFLLGGGEKRTSGRMGTKKTLDNKMLHNNNFPKKY